MHHDSPVSDDLKQLRKLVDGQRVAMLTTLGNDGRLDARPMTVLELDDQGCFWFLCEHEPQDLSAPVRYARVNLAFSDESKSTYVSLPGRGELRHDRERIEQLWTPMAKPWFPDGPDSPNLAVLKVQPDLAEVWDAPDSRIVRGLALAASVVVGRPVGLGGHEVLNPRGGARPVADEPVVTSPGHVPVASA